MLLTNNTYAARKAATATLFGNYFGMNDCKEILSQASQFINAHNIENDGQLNDIVLCLEQMAGQFDKDW